MRATGGNARRLRAVWVALALACWLTPASAFATITADSAIDVCSASANPCVVSQPVIIVSGSVLDFGLRALRLQGSGQLDAAGGTARVRAGSITIQVSGTGIKLNEGTIGGLLTLEAYGTCSGNPAQRCLNDIGCAAAGVCTGGSGDILLDGKTVGSAEIPSSLIMRAAGDVRIAKRVQMEGNTFIADGGSIDVQAHGSVFLDDLLQLNSGGEGTGGEVSLDAGQDLFVSSAIEAQGGDFDGGSIELTAGRDVLIIAPVSADANTGEGFGGSIEVTAGRNIEATGGTSLSNLFLTTEGHTGYDGNTAFAGDGGFQDYIADGSISFGRYVKLRANGAAPDGSGDEIALEAVGPVTLAGSLESRSKGALGAGGFIDLSSDDKLTLTSTGILDVTGGESGGGEVVVFARGDVTIAGLVTASATDGGVGGLIDLESELKLSVSGDLENSGQSFGAAVGFNTLSGCRIDVLAGASISNPAPGGLNTFFVANLLKIFAGASVTAGSGGKNRIQYRDPTVPPVILGTVTPTASKTVNTNLPSCPLCGNFAVNLGETCDDGNLVSGDGCSAECQNEGCVADTPGYPGVALCYDANPCTLDRCDMVAGACVHETSCDDGFVCTFDQCVSGSCTHTPLDELCDDNNECTSQSCGAGLGCSIAAISGSCDDDLYCNGGDTCLGGACGAHTGNPCIGQPECLDVCDELTDACRAPFGHPCSTDANTCTDDVCSGLGGCLHVNNTASCDNGTFCDGPDFCSGGACAISLGNPCDASSDCAHTCDEGVNVCRADPGDSCTDDGNACTDDFCDGGGGCAHTPNAAPCDDGDMCTQTDVCSASACSATDRVAFVSVRVSGVRKTLADDDRLGVKATATTADFAQSPIDGGVLLTMRDDTGAELWAAYLPGDMIVDQGARGTTFRFRDTNGQVPTANGVSSATFKRVPSAGVVRVNVKARGLELADFSPIEAVDFSMLVGSSPSQGNCMSSKGLECSKSTSASLRCAN